MNKTLTIAIPTFNGDKYIAITINSVLNQIKNNPLLESKTEIVVSDNASQDNVAGVVKQYKTMYPNVVQYYRNETNVGFDRNVDLAVRRATGEFVWILSDDDIVLDGAIEYVQNVIENHKDEKVALIYVDYPSKAQLTNEHDGLCKDGNVFFQETRFKNNLISCNIVSRSIWQTSRVERFFDSGWIHSGYALEALNPLCGYKAFIINKKFVKQGGKTQRWGQGGTFIYAGFKLVEIYKLMPQWGYSPKTRKMTESIKRVNWLYIPLAKAKGLKTDFKLLSQFYGLYKQYPSFWLIDLPLLLIPKKFHYIIYTLIRSVKHLVKKMQ